MTALIYLFALAAVSQVNARVVDLSCSDNATCIDNMAKELARSVRQQKAVRLFNIFTLEPLENRQARSNEDPLTRMLRTYAISVDWNDFTFRLSNPEIRDDAMDLEVFESRSAKDVTEKLPKKSNSKVEEEVPEDKTPKGTLKKRRHKKKVLQAVIPMLFGMKSAGAAIFGLAAVTVLTLKAFFASKMALGVTIYLAMKKLYESYGTGVGLQNHPYLYSQYPIDFPSATSHAYSVSGVSQQFASPEMYSPTALGATHTHELLQHSDASAQQSQQAPTVLVNSTRAAERWDGKSKLQRLFEPMLDKIRSVIDPIASVFYDAMPATFRGLNSDVSTAKTEADASSEDGKKPREILVPQPRHIAQRKMHRKGSRQRPKKYTELKLDLNRLKQNKDLHDYIKTKKYKYNYPQTYFYPRVKYFVNPTYFFRPNNSRLMPYNKPPVKQNTSFTNDKVIRRNVTTEWKPIIMFHPIFDFDNETVTNNAVYARRKRAKRSIESSENKNLNSLQNNNMKVDNTFHKKPLTGGRGSFNILDFFFNPLEVIVKQADTYTKGVIKHSLKSTKPPIHYTIAYAFLMQFLEAIDGLYEIHKDVQKYLFDGHHHGHKKRKIKRKIIKKKSKRKDSNKVAEAAGNVTVTVHL